MCGQNLYPYYLCLGHGQKKEGRLVCVSTIWKTKTHRAWGCVEAWCGLRGPCQESSSHRRQLSREAAHGALSPTSLPNCAGHQAPYPHPPSPSSSNFHQPVHKEGQRAHSWACCAAPTKTRRNKGKGQGGGGGFSSGALSFSPQVRPLLFKCSRLAFGSFLRCAPHEQTNIVTVEKNKGEECKK